MAAVPVVSLSYGRLQELTGAPRREIEASLPHLGLDIEGGGDDTVRVEYSPNRPDYSTEYGVALGLQGLLGTAEGPVPLEAAPSGRRITVKPAVSKVRPFITAIAATGGRVDDLLLAQLSSLREGLDAGLGRGRVKSYVGLHDLRSLRFPLMYGSATRGHKFEPAGGKEATVADMLADTEYGARYGFLLGAGSRVPVLLDAADRTVSLPPVAGSSRTAPRAGTRGLLAEVTGLSKRGVEDVLAVVALVLASAGFKLEAVDISGVRNAAPDLAPSKMRVPAEYVCRALGLEIPAKQMVSCLARCRIGAEASGGWLECMIPPYRFDILGPADIAEEVALGLGIGSLKPVLAPTPVTGRADPATRVLRTISETLTGLGYSEALSPCLATEVQLYGADGRDASAAVRVLEPEGEGAVLRDSLLPGLLACLSSNIHEPYPQRIFETGTVFAGDGHVTESERLCCAVSHGGASYTEAKSVLQAVAASLGDACATRAASVPWMEPGRSAEILVGGATAGFIGEISSRELARLRLREPVAAFELSTGGWLEAARSAGRAAGKAAGKTAGKTAGRARKAPGGKAGGKAGGKTGRKPGKAAGRAAGRRAK
ncbi:MAG: phenylalanine--tRNA ligase subunit beta [Nitrosopumilus sp.]|nr:phenylalanine--tRNA ligase subunit beta [Nitrosopumilus sp.]MDA7954381.1 phenylalanine--tRNA ligase subunit beta [Nitrosopumilus sp.]MDA7974207.1 phenylalanine--tRNA ligase subunit beta [Nitrosopumilus sp.]